MVAVSPNANSIPRYEVFELSFKHNRNYANNFLDVDVGVVFTSPSGAQYRVKGFYFAGNLWRVRFRPDAPGQWTYKYVMTSAKGLHDEGTGSFDCTASDAEGPIHRNPANPYQWIFANGKPYFPVGLQDCIMAKGTQLTGIAIDGEKRDGHSAKQISMDEYFSIYGQAGFNLFRFSQNNCSYALFDDLDHYREAEGMATDELLSLARNQGFRVMFGFFGFYDHLVHSKGRTGSPKGIMERLSGTPDEQEVIAREKRFIAYCVARWGVYVDFWELLNESIVSDEWTTMMADYVRSIDPDRKPISTSWEKPSLSAVDINSPHWYESEREPESDLRVQQQASAWKKAGKPVIVSEQGNTGMNWDPLSGQRMRIRSWTALFQEIGLVFWNTSWSKAGMFKGHYNPGPSAANIYLGPEERRYVRVLRDFSSQLDTEVRTIPVQVSAQGRVRAYGLASSRVAGVYLHHFENHHSSIHDLKISLNIPVDARTPAPLVGNWIDPSTGNTIGSIQVLSSRQELDVPPFPVDLALLITSAHK